MPTLNISRLDESWIPYAGVYFTRDVRITYVADTMVCVVDGKMDVVDGMAYMVDSTVYVMDSMLDLSMVYVVGSM